MSKIIMPKSNAEVHAYASTAIAHLMFAHNKLPKGVKRGSLKHAMNRLESHVASLTGTEWDKYAKRLGGYTTTTKTRLAHEAVAAYKLAHGAGESDVEIIFPKALRNAKKLAAAAV